MNKVTSMTWIESSTSPKKGVATYELWNDNKKMMVLEHNQLSQTANIHCFNTRRVFKIEKEGFLRNKTIFKNEYGVKIGYLSNEKWFNNEGVINLNEEKLYYTSNSKELQKLVIYKKTPHQPLIECSLSENSLHQNFNLKKHTEADNYPALLVALVWFLFLPVAKEQNAVMAGL